MVDIISSRWFYIVVCLTGTFLLFCLIFYLVLLKSELRNIKKELERTRTKNYNRQLTVSLFEKDLTELTAEINKNLDYQTMLKLQQEQAEKTLKQSISDIAHDLRTPLTVIKGNLQMIEREETLSPKGEDYLRICKEKSDVLKTMVEDFFELSVLESEHEEVEFSTVDITKYLMQFIIDHEAVIREYGKQPELELPQKSVFIQANEDMLGRMFGNMLNNILKYGKNRFWIKLETKECFKDNSTGEGCQICRILFINEVLENQEFDVDHLFDRTYRGDKARTDTGAGLGLYIVKLLAKRQKATVYVERENHNLSMIVEFDMETSHKGE